MRPALHLLAAAASLVAATAAAQPLPVVSVSAPQINCLFTTSSPCSVTVSDVASPLLGNGFLQSRTFQAQPGSPAAGKWVYEYRLDLRNATGGTTPQVVVMTIPFPAAPVHMDFNADGNANDQVFVVTGGALGSVSPFSVILYSDSLIVSFMPPVTGGQSSYFIGLVSVNPPQDVVARVTTNVAGDVLLKARAPGAGASITSSSAPAARVVPAAPPVRPRPVPPAPARP